MQIGLMLPQSGRLASPGALIDVAQAAESLGFSAVAVRDHLVFNGAYITLGMKDLDVPGDDRDMFEALETLTYVAGHTSTIRLGTSVLILPNRHPLLLAKQTSTLDVLSGGRLVLGFGIGPNRRETERDTTILGEHRTNLVREYDTFGARGPRGPRMDEYFEAMVAIWTAERPSYRGEHVRFDEVDVFPKPVQEPYPPILVGGRSEAARRRAARWDAGWLPSQATTGEIGAGVANLRELRTEAGKSPEPGTIGVNIHSAIADDDAAAEAMAWPTLGRHFADRTAFLDRTITGGIDTVIERARAYRDAGVTYLELKPVCRSIDHLLEQMRAIHDDVMPAVS